MLTLITGTPGAGKTSYAVAELARLLKATPRELIVLGIPELQLPHELAPPVEQWTKRVPVPGNEDLSESEFTCPDGALIVIDEAQKVFRPRSTGSKVPDNVAAFEKHRHKGLDFWLITQHPNLLDAQVRRLVGKHIHVRGHWAGRELLEWPEATDPDSRSERGAAVRQRYTLPKEAFGLYKSASMHIKQKRRIPRMLYVVVVLLVVALGLGYRVYDRIAGAIKGETITAQPGEALRGATAAVGGPAGNASPQGAGLSLEAFTPRLRGRPESAPLYDQLRAVVAVPVVVGCVASRTRCQCVTEQGSDAGYSVDECRAWLKSPPFSPFRAVLPPVQVERSVKGIDVRPAPVQPEKPLLRLPDKA